MLAALGKQKNLVLLKRTISARSAQLKPAELHSVLRVPLPRTTTKIAAAVVVDLEESREVKKLVMFPKRKKRLSLHPNEPGNKILTLRRLRSLLLRSLRTRQSCSLLQS